MKHIANFVIYKKICKQEQEQEQEQEEEKKKEKEKKRDKREAVSRET